MEQKYFLLPLELLLLEEQLVLEHLEEVVRHSKQEYLHHFLYYFLPQFFHCGISRRVLRNYISGGEMIRCVDYLLDP